MLDGRDSAVAVLFGQTGIRVVTLENLETAIADALEAFTPRECTTYFINSG